MQQKEVTLKGKRIFYRTVGEGPTVVLLHGFGEDGAIWKNQFDAFPDFKLIIPDLPGSGKSEMIEDMSIEGLAEAIQQLIIHEQEQLPPPAPPTGENNPPIPLEDDSFDEGEFYYNADPLTYNLVKQFVKQHRAQPTQAEDFLWQQLKNKQLKGYKFRRQHVIGNFIADFVCLSKKLIIEVDGLIHQLPENRISDKERTMWLESKGYSVFRISNEEVLHNIEQILSEIKQKLDLLPFAEKKRFTKQNVSLTSKAGAADPSPVGGSRMGAIMIGHSMGGYITLAFVDKFHYMLNGFGLFHSTSFADSEEKKATRNKGIEFINQHGPFEFLKTTIPNLYSSITKEQKKSFIDEHIQAAHNFSGAALVSYYVSMIERPDRSHLLKQTHLPVLFIMGRHDTAVPMEDGLKQCHLPNRSYVHILEDSGHMGMVEETEKTNRILNQYLKAISNRLPD